MKALLTLLSLSFVAATTGYFVQHQRAENTLRGELRGAHPELAWLHREFHLDEQHFAKVRELEAAYEPRCHALADQLTAADAEAARLIATHEQVAEPVTTALAKCAELHALCQRETLAHVYAVAALMSKADAAHYIKNMLPSVLEPGVAVPRASVQPSQ